MRTRVSRFVGAACALAALSVALAPSLAAQVAASSTCEPVVLARPRTGPTVPRLATVPRLHGGDGSVRFVGLRRPRLMALSFVGDGPTEPVMDFALYLTGDGKVRLREGDGSDREVAEYRVGDEFEIGVHSGVAQYTLNGEVLHESTEPVRYPLAVFSCVAETAGSPVSGPPLPGWPLGSGPPPVPTREEFAAGAWFASPEWSWNAEPFSAPVTTASAPTPERLPALSDRVGEILDLAKETPLGPHGQQALASALGDNDADLQAAAIWVLAEMAAGGDTNAAAEIETETPAKVIEQGKGKYPPAAFVKKIQGDVVLDVLISRTGRVVYAQVRQSIPLLDAAALEAVRRWTFAPAHRRGGPFPSVTRVSVPFRIF